MKKQRILFITELMGYLLILAAIYCIVSAIIFFVDDSDKMLINTLCVMAIPLVQYFFKYLKGAVAFAICHICVLGICACIIIKGTFGIMPSLLYSIVWIAMFVIFFSLRKSDKVVGVQTPSGAPIVIMVITYFIMYGKGSDTYLNVVSVIMIVSILVYFINMYIANSFIFFEGNIASAVMNYKNSMNFTTRLMAAFVAICGGIMGISTFLPSFGLIEFIKKILFNIASFIAGLLSSKHIQNAPKATNAPVNPTPTPTPTQGVLTTVSEKNVDLDKFFYPIMVAAAIIFIIAIIVAIFAGLKTLEKKNEDEERFFVSPFSEDEQKAIPEEGKEKKEGFFSRVLSRNPNRRVRRAFHKAITVNLDLGEKLKSSMTPSQLCDSTSLRKKGKKTKWDFIQQDNNEITDDDLEKLKNIYEQARYGNVPCSREEAVLAESLQKRL